MMGIELVDIDLLKRVSERLDSSYYQEFHDAAQKDAAQLYVLAAAVAPKAAADYYEVWHMICVTSDGQLGQPSFSRYARYEDADARAKEIRRKTPNSVVRIVPKFLGIDDVR